MFKINIIIKFERSIDIYEIYKYFNSFSLKEKLETDILPILVAAILHLRRKWKPTNRTCHPRRPWVHSLRISIAAVRADLISRSSSSRVASTAVKVVISKAISSIHRRRIRIMLIIKIGSTVRVDRRLTDLTISGDLIIITEWLHDHFPGSTMCWFLSTVHSLAFYFADFDLEVIGRRS